MDFNIIIAGFGGQGVLIAGKIIVLAAMHSNKQVTWLPSYGPEMRGGTANCTVVVSDNEIGSPITGKPQNLIILSLPSKQKFESIIQPGGTMLLNSSMISEPATREDIKNFSLPLIELSEELKAPKSINIIALGAFFEINKIFDNQKFMEAIEESFSHKPEFIEINKKAFELGAKYIRDNKG